MNDQTLDPQLHIHELGSRARAAARQLLTASTEAKNTALTEAAKALRAAMPTLLEANAKDVASVAGKKDASFIDRLELTEDRIEGMAADAVQTVQTTDRAAVAALLQADEFVDLVIPRGGRGLVELVRDQASVPTLLHLDGNCHSYVHSAADLDKAVKVIRNAKLRRTGVCGATESVVVDRAVAADAMVGECELRGDDEAVAIDSRLTRASEEDWDTEYLGPIASVKIVDGLAEGIAWVDTHSSHHTDAILTEDAEAARRFMTAIDSAVVMHNASTQFSDGGEFGMGAEIGIATGKMHARGPVGLEQLTSFKYLVHGDGQTRA